MSYTFGVTTEVDGLKEQVESGEGDVDFDWIEVGIVHYCGTDISDEILKGGYVSAPKVASRLLCSPRSSKVDSILSGFLTIRSPEDDVFPMVDHWILRIRRDFGFCGVLFQPSERHDISSMESSGSSETCEVKEEDRVEAGVRRYQFETAYVSGCPEVSFGNVDRPRADEHQLNNQWIEI